jgi:two-component system nitrogen regulation response regulator GlnG
MVARLLKNDLSVLILGESGTGKELVAEAIHNLGHRKTGPFVAVNMAAIPAELIEAELFGHEKGAFTGAIGQSIGKFEQAQGGTLFLDEIGDMPMQAQTRLLRALQTGAITRIGGKANIKLDVRIITATNQDFDKLIADGKFREDLYYRINVVPIQLPPLRERIEDIDALAQHFLTLAAREGLPAKQIDAGAIDQLRLHGWRGNVRELKNVIYRLAVTTREDVIGVEAVARQLSERRNASPRAAGGGLGMASAVIQLVTAARQNKHLDGGLYEHVLGAMEKPLLEEVLKRTRGNQLRAASLLGINRNTLRKKLQERGIRATRD